MKKIILVYIVQAFLISFGYAQLNISGHVLSVSDNLPIEGATISTGKGDFLGRTDNEGKFTVVLTDLSVQLYISHTGKATKILSIAEMQDMGEVKKIFLDDADNVIEEVIINTGYSSQKIGKATGAYSVIDSESLNRGVSSNVLERLEGLSTSIHFDRRTTGTSSMAIRGLSTIYANREPLIVLDNFPYEGDISDINPNEIESVTVLKDAVAASIWGVRAGNGVIVLTTKKDHFQQPIRASFTASASVVGRPDLRNYKVTPSPDFIELEMGLFEEGYYSLFESSPTSPVLSPVVETLIKQRDGLITSEEADRTLSELGSYNVKDELRRHWFERGLNQQYALSITGGGRKSSYSILLGHDRERGTLLDANRRSNLKFDVQHKLFPKVDVSGSVRYTRSSNDVGRPAIESLAATTTKGLLPYTRLADNNGNPLIVPRNYRESFIEDAAENGLLDWSYVPLEDYLHNTRNSTSDHLLFNVALSYRFMKGFRLDAMFQREHSTTQRLTHYSKDSYFARDLINVFSKIEDDQIVRPVPIGGVIDNGTSTLASNNLRTQLNYTYTADLHDLSSTVGFELRQIGRNGNTFRRYGYDENNLTSSDVDFLSDHPFYYFPLFTGRIPNNVGFSETLNRYISAYALANYTFKNRYHTNISIRRDAANLFGVKENQRWVPLWSAGVGWTLSNEHFYQSSDLPYLKLRASYGYNGNVDNSLTALTTLLYSGSLANLVNQPYARVFTPPNPNLRWERNGVWNIGVDFQGFSNRISGSVDLFRKTGLDLIGDAPLDPTTGVANGSNEFVFRGNVAAMRGRGFDVELHTKNTTGRIKWQTDVFASYYDNEITKYEQVSPLGRSYINNGLGVVPIIGKPLYSMYAYKWAGLDKETGDPMGVLDGLETKDYSAILNGTTIENLEYFGSAIPTHTGSIVNTFSYKNISFSFMLSYRMGHYYREGSLQYNRLYTDWMGHSDYAKRWQNPGDEAWTNVPSAIYPADSNRDTFYAGSGVHLKKGDNIRLQDLKLSYDLSSLVARHRIRKAQLFAHARNLGMIWAANGKVSDPDVLSNTILGKEFSLGLNIHF